MRLFLVAFTEDAARSDDPTASRSPLAFVASLIGLVARMSGRIDRMQTRNWREGRVLRRIGPRAVRRIDCHFWRSQGVLASKSISFAGCDLRGCGAVAVWQPPWNQR